MPELPACSTCGARFIAVVKFCERCGTPVLPQAEAGSFKAPPGPQVSSGPMVTGKSGVPEKTPFTASSGPDLPATVDDALFFISDEPAPVPDTEETGHRTHYRGVIVFLAIILAGVWFIGLPMLTGSGAAGGPVTPAAEVTSVSGTAMVTTIVPMLTDTVVPATVSDALAPRPTDMVPGGLEVSFLVRKDPVTAKITVTLAGGPSVDSISSSEVKVTHPDGAVTTGIILPFKGSTEIVLEGSKDTDRVEIVAKMSDSRTYRVYDELVPFRD
jgi:hypothetical protein